MAQEDVTAHSRPGWLQIILWLFVIFHIFYFCGLILLFDSFCVPVHDLAIAAVAFVVLYMNYPASSIGKRIYSASLLPSFACLLITPWVHPFILFVPGLLMVAAFAFAWGQRRVSVCVLAFALLWSSTAPAALGQIVHKQRILKLIRTDRCELTNSGIGMQHENQNLRKMIAFPWYETRDRTFSAQGFLHCSGEEELKIPAGIVDKHLIIKVDQHTFYALCETSFSRTTGED